MASGDLAEETAKLKAQEGKPIIAHGEVSFARSLVAQGLVDQFALIVALVALGKGLPLFSELAAPTPLKLMSLKAFPGDAVAQTYLSGGVNPSAKVLLPAISQGQLLVEAV